MKNYITIAIRPESYEAYKKLKTSGTTWNAIVVEGITAITNRLNGNNTEAVIDKLQKALTKMSMENEILRNKFKMQELKDKLTNNEISQEDYNTFKAMYEEKIKSIDLKIQEAEE